MAMVLLTLVTAVSLVFGMTTIAAHAATELAWPEAFTTSDWQGPMELWLPTNYSDFNGGDLNPTAENVAKVRITRGETVYKASHVYGWKNKLAFYFNGSNYDGKNAQKGDILTVDAGFTITISKNGNEYISTEEKNYIFNGATWIDGTELPAEKGTMTVTKFGMRVLTVKRTLFFTSIPMRKTKLISETQISRTREGLLRLRMRTVR